MQIINYYLKFCRLKGRAQRKEYWTFTIINSIINLSATYFASYNPLLALCFLPYLLLSIPPSLGVTVRRLHDINRSGWFYFIKLIPFIGYPIFFIMLLQPSSLECKYGNT